MSKVPIIFRQATQDDVADLTQIRIKQLIDEGYPETRDIHQELNEYFSSSLDNGSLAAWVGVAEDQIIATAGLCIYQLPCTFSNPSGKQAYITNIYTRDDYRKKGIASHLVDQLLAEAKSLGFSNVRLHASNHGKSIYKKAGFVNAEDFMELKF